MDWRLAKSLETLRNQINVQWPKRNKASDGTIGDAAHRAQGSNSDHNPWVKDGGVGVVTALDITHDPKNGADMHKLADILAKSKDGRIKYIIWNRRILVAPNWNWRKHEGDPHTSHLHLSIKSTKALFDNTKKWRILSSVSSKTAKISSLTSEILYRLYLGQDTSKVGKKYIGKHTVSQEVERIKKSKAYKNRIASAKAGTLNYKAHLPAELRNNLK